MRCGHCGKKLKNNAKFCTYCGHYIVETNEAPQKSGGYLAAILSLTAVIAILVSGGVWLVMEGMYPAKSVSASDLSPVSFDTDGTRTDEKLVGTWRCTDRTAADYEEADYGIAVDILLTIQSDGTYRMDYTMFNTGVVAVKLTSDGSYIAQKGNLRFSPLAADPDSEFLKKHGAQPTFGYHAYETMMELAYEDGKTVVFHRE